MNAPNDPTLERLLAHVRDTRVRRRRRGRVAAATATLGCVALVSVIALRPAVPTPVAPTPVPGPMVAAGGEAEGPGVDLPPTDATARRATVVRTGRARTGIVRVTHIAGGERIQRLSDEAVLERLREIGKPAGIIRVGDEVFLDAPWLQANASDADELGVDPAPGAGGI